MELFISNFLNYIFEWRFLDIHSGYRFHHSKRGCLKKVEIQQKNLVKTATIIECVELGENCMVNFIRTRHEMQWAHFRIKN